MGYPVLSGIGPGQKRTTAGHTNRVFGITAFKADPVIDQFIYETVFLQWRIILLACIIFQNGSNYIDYWKYLGLDSLYRKILSDGCKSQW
ncbi:MAG: hypothetical protein PF479_12505 [Oceanispirochaeta sp.]|nr:hypothetical protein [Oceanispirochaeta sp.]MDA3957535.1 hypothetical protein [Oceanispirochaeta sp.]